MFLRKKFCFWSCSVIFFTLSNKFSLNKICLCYFKRLITILWWKFIMKNYYLLIWNIITLYVCNEKFNDFSREMWPRHAWITKNNEGGLWIYLAGVSKRYRPEFYRYSVGSYNYTLVYSFTRVFLKKSFALKYLSGNQRYIYISLRCRYI